MNQGKQNFRTSSQMLLKDRKMNTALHNPAVQKGNFKLKKQIENKIRETKTEWHSGLSHKSANKMKGQGYTKTCRGHKKQILGSQKRAFNPFALP